MQKGSPGLRRDGTRDRTSLFLCTDRLRCIPWRFFKLFLVDFAGFSVPKMILLDWHEPGAYL